MSSNWRLSCHINFSRGVVSGRLRSAHPQVASALHSRRAWLTLLGIIYQQKQTAGPGTAPLSGTRAVPFPVFLFHIGCDWQVGWAFAVEVGFILAEGAIALSVTLSGDALFAS